jgi:hypothetical protein
MEGRFECARTVGAALVDVALHLEVAVLGAQVGVGGEQHLHVLRILGQLRQRLSSRGRHGCCWGLWRREGEEKEEGSLCGSGGAKGEGDGRGSYLRYL